MGKEWKEKEREREDRERKAGITTSRTGECHEEAGLHSCLLLSLHTLRGMAPQAQLLSGDMGRQDRCEQAPTGASELNSRLEPGQKGQKMG